MGNFFSCIVIRDRAVSAGMKVIGLTDELMNDAERQCAVEFRAWRVEAQNGTWGNWEELVKRYPRLSRIDEEEGHIPLREDGTGILVRPFFAQQLMLLRRICQMPVHARLKQAGRFPQNMMQTHQPA